VFLVSADTPRRVDDDDMFGDDEGSESDGDEGPALPPTSPSL